MVSWEGIPYASAAMRRRAAGWYSVLDVAEALRVTPTCVRRWIRAGKLVGARAGSLHVVSAMELAKFLAKRKALPTD